MNTVVYDEVKKLADKYSRELKKQVDSRVEEMSKDDNSHYLIYRVLGVSDKEGNLIRTYLNASEAARSIGILPSSLRNTIRRKGYTRDGYYFEYLEEESSSTSINTQELNSEVQDN